jgi:hypothetical protein
LIGEIEKPAIIQPNSVKLIGTIGEKISQKVTITPRPGDAFNIIKVSPYKGTDIRYTMEKINLFGKKAYQLTVENIKKTEGRYLDNITITTDRSDFPPLVIIVTGVIEKSPGKDNKAPENQPPPIDAMKQKQ